LGSASQFLHKVQAALVTRLVAQFDLWQRLGIHMTPVHFYAPIPDTRSLPESLWERPSDLVGLDMREDEQLQMLSTLASNFKSEYDALPRDSSDFSHQYVVENDSFTSVDGEMLYCMVRSSMSSRVIEIGSGMSTRLIAQALTVNEAETGRTASFTVIDPFPSPVVQEGFRGLSHLVQTGVEVVSYEKFAELGEGDILFIDSSHTVKVGNDVHRECLDILPRLAPGVIVHFHDIFLPWEYPREWIMDKQLFWAEQYLLQAFLCFNPAFEVVWAASYMHTHHRHALEDAFASYDSRRHWPGSFWIHRVQ
jgi:hypothetical protein